MMAIFFLLNTLVYQNGDTLLFMKQDSIISRWILGEEIQPLDSLEARVIKRVKVSPDNKFFFIHEETYASSSYKPLQTKIVYYDANKVKIWEEFHNDERIISYKLSNIYDSLLVFVDMEQNGKIPRLCTIKNKKKDIIIEKGEWQRVVNYAISPNCRYMVFHNRNHYFDKMWDYIYAVDLKLKKNWTYLFPLCLSCKRGKIALNIDDTGTAEVIHKGEHRIFSNEGNLIDFFLE